jgi:hypothetical protein
MWGWVGKKDPISLLSSAKQNPNPWTLIAGGKRNQWKEVF